jgi:hypothetical protein
VLIKQRNASITPGGTIKYGKSIDTGYIKDIRHRLKANKTKQHRKSEGEPITLFDKQLNVSKCSLLLFQRIQRSARKYVHCILIYLEKAASTLVSIILMHSIFQISIPVVVLPGENHRPVTNQ